MDCTCHAYHNDHVDVHHGGLYACWCHELQGGKCCRHLLLHERAVSGLVQSFNCSVHALSFSCPFVCLFMHPLVHASIHPFIYPTFHPSIHPSIYSFFHTCHQSSIHPSIHLSIHSFVRSFFHSCCQSFIHGAPWSFAGSSLGVFWI